MKEPNAPWKDVITSKYTFMEGDWIPSFKVLIKWNKKGLWRSIHKAMHS